MVKGKRAITELHDFLPARRAALTALRSTIGSISRLPGVQVFDAKGGYLGTIKLGRHPANVAFAGPGRHTLHITARVVQCSVCYRTTFSQPFRSTLG
ncbi:hypothetical protein SAMN02990966_07457 [Rhodospirillales bacterium URHD0017]|nr:hypothetical protein SAMN02990966_07457 [Rhodospirillales bacterium URHD0017]